MAKRCGKGNPCSNKTFYNQFRQPESSTPPGPQTLLEIWYDSLIVKPSAGLYSDLQTLFNALNAAGEIDKMAFLSVIAGMETDEQRLRPIYTASGLDCTNENGATLDVNGAKSDGATSYIDSRWNAALHGDGKYTQNLASMGAFVGNNGDSHFPFGASEKLILPNFAGDFYSVVNSMQSTITPTLQGKHYAAKRIDLNNQEAYIDGQLKATLAASSAEILSFNQFICAFNNAGVAAGFSTSYVRATYAGGDLNIELISNLFRDFFLARGLAYEVTLENEIFGQDGGAGPSSWNFPTGWAETGEAGQFYVEDGDVNIQACDIVGSSALQLLVFVGNTANPSTITTSAISTLGKSNIKVFWNEIMTNANNDNFTLEYSINGIAWSAIAIPQLVSDFVWHERAPISVPAAADNQATLYFRLTKTGDGFSSFDAIDDFKVTGE